MRKSRYSLIIDMNSCLNAIAIYPYLMDRTLKHSFFVRYIRLSGIFTCHFNDKLFKAIINFIDYSDLLKRIVGFQPLN